MENNSARKFTTSRNTLDFFFLYSWRICIVTFSALDEHAQVHSPDFRDGACALTRAQAYTLDTKSLKVKNVMQVIVPFRQMIDEML